MQSASRLMRGRRYKNTPCSFLFQCINPFPRCVTTCLMVMLSEFFPSYRIVFQFLISLDISSHWLHMYRYVYRLGSMHVSAKI